MDESRRPRRVTRTKSIFVVQHISYNVSEKSASFNSRQILKNNSKSSKHNFHSYQFYSLHSYFSKMDQSQSGRLVNFRLLYLITQLVGVVIAILIASWIGIHLNGFGWDYDEPRTLFNWHPMLMSIGMVFLYGNCKLENSIK